VQLVRQTLFQPVYQLKKDVFVKLLQLNIIGIHKLKYVQYVLLKGVQFNQEKENVHQLIILIEFPNFVFFALQIVCRLVFHLKMVVFAQTVTIGIRTHNHALLVQMEFVLLLHKETVIV
jgi:hypothetical protein